MVTRCVRIYVIQEDDAARAAFCASLKQEADDMEVLGTAPNFATARYEMEQLRADVGIYWLDPTLEQALPSLRSAVKAHPKTAFLVLLDQPAYDDMDSILRCGVLGLCYSRTSLPTLITGIRATADGCMWLSPTIAVGMQQILDAAAKPQTEQSKHRQLIHANLTEREAQILRHVSQGMTNQKIASILNLSVETVKTYMRRIMDKSSIRTRRELMSALMDKSVS